MKKTNSKHNNLCEYKKTNHNVHFKNNLKYNSCIIIFNNNLKNV